jgi:group I intron endonuclease
VIFHYGDINKTKGEIMKPIGFVYITTNLVNCKRYIGQCKFSNKRWKTYLGSGKHLKEAFKKYGKENFKKEIICYAFSTEDLNYLETLFISEYDAVNDRNFYNIASGGYTTRGFQGKSHTEEFKQKMKEKMIGHSVSQKTKEHMKMVGSRKRNEDEKQNMREKMTKAWENGSHPRAKPFSLFGKIYPTQEAAAKDLGLSRRQLVYKFKDQMVPTSF